jgi:flagellar biogenesis protein FliO
MKTTAPILIMALASLAAAEPPRAAKPSYLEAPAQAGPTPEIGWIVAGAIACAAGAIAWFAKRRANLTIQGEALKVLAEKTLGGRNRLVLVEAKGREILLSVSDRGAQRILDWWADDEGEDTGDLPSRPAPAAMTPSIHAEPPTVSEAVSGLYRLRSGKTNPRLSIAPEWSEREIPEMTRR